MQLRNVAFYSDDIYSSYNFMNWVFCWMSNGLSLECRIHDGYIFK